MLGGHLDAELRAALTGDGWTLIPCRDGAELLEAVVERRPGVVIVALAGSEHDLRLLQLVRRAVPDVPLILVSGEGDLDLQRTLQAVRPYYYDITPIDPAELREAVRSALRPGRGPRADR